MSYFKYVIVCLFFLILAFLNSCGSINIFSSEAQENCASKTENLTSVADNFQMGLTKDKILEDFIKLSDEDFQSRYIHYNKLFFYQYLKDYGVNYYNDRFDKCLVYNRQFEGQVIGSIKLGSDFNEVYEILGTPRYINNNLTFIGYELSDCVLFFHGKETVDKVTIRKKVEQQGIAELLINKLENIEEQDNLGKLAQDLKEMGFDNKMLTTLRAGSYILSFDFGFVLEYDSINDKIYINIYSNFEGSIPEIAHDNIIVHLCDTDYFYKKEIEAAQSFYKIKSTEDALFSVNGTKMLFIDYGKLIEDTRIWVEEQDGIYFYIPVGEAQFFEWLDERYILCSAVFGGIQIIDTKTLYIDFKFDEYFNNEPYTLEERLQCCEKVTNVDINNRLIFCGEEFNTIDIFYYSYDEFGNLELIRCPDLY